MHLGGAYDPERDWTSLLRVRSGYNPHIESFWDPSADFTLRDSVTRENMVRFLLEHGRSNTPGWENHLRANSAVYHIDVAVTSGSKHSRFTISSNTLERVSHPIFSWLINGCNAVATHTDYCPRCESFGYGKAMLPERQSMPATSPFSSGSAMHIPTARLPLGYLSIRGHSSPQVTSCYPTDGFCRGRA